MKTALSALLVALAASAGACWFYLDALESDLRALIEEMSSVQTGEVDFEDFTRRFADVVEEDWDVALDEQLADARAWTWRHVYPRLVVFAFVCAVATSFLARRRATAEAG